MAPNAALVRTVVAARTVRSFAYGMMTVVLAGILTARGFEPAAVGTLITLMLLAGAATSAFSGRLVDRLGARATFFSAGLAMVVGAALLLGGQAAVIIACALGVISPGGQDVGPFAAIEQITLAASANQTNRAFAWYNVAAAAGFALGALLAGFVTATAVVIGYAAAGVVTAALSGALPDVRVPHDRTGDSPRANRGVVERLVALFALDAFAGGFVVQAFIAYWFALRFGVGPDRVGPLLFGANLLAGASFLAAERVARRIGLLRTMVFTHLPSNVLLCLLAFMPTFPLAATVLLARFALSQMDVPTRQAFTIAIVPPGERARAAGLAAAVRPAAAAVSPAISGIAFQFAALGVPFIIGGALKIVYDLALLASFRNVVAYNDDDGSAGD